MGSCLSPWARNRKPFMKIGEQIFSDPAEPFARLLGFRTIVVVLPLEALRDSSRRFLGFVRFLNYDMRPERFIGTQTTC